MKLGDKKTMLNSLLENVEVQQEIVEQIDLFNRMLDLKKSNAMGEGVQSWTISELESRINEYKDKLHGFEKIYKELLQMLVS